VRGSGAGVLDVDDGATTTAVVVGATVDVVEGAIVVVVGAGSRSASVTDSDP